MKFLIRTMNKKIEPRFVLFGVILIVVVLCVGYLSKNFVLRQYDAARLSRFAHRIADADHIVASFYRSSVSLTLTGDNATKIVRAVSSASSARMPNEEFACKYDLKATFYRGTNVLGDIQMCGSLFLLNWGQPPFFDYSELLDTAVYTPALEAERESYQKSGPTK